MCIHTNSSCSQAMIKLVTHTHTHQNFSRGNVALHFDDSPRLRPITELLTEQYTLSTFDGPNRRVHPSVIHTPIIHMHACMTHTHTHTHTHTRSHIHCTHTWLHSSTSHTHWYIHIVHVLQCMYIYSACTCTRFMCLYVHYNVLQTLLCTHGCYQLQSG